MTRKPQGLGETASGPSGAVRGFTLSETIVVVFLIGILTAIVVNSVQNSIERARMASCMNELRGIQAALWYDSDGGNKAIDPKTFWDTHYKGTKPGPYVLLLDARKPNDGSAKTGSDVYSEPAFVVVGRYQHWAPGQYVFIEDDEPPRFVAGPDEDPGYNGQIDWEAGQQWGANGRTAATAAANPTWAGSQSNSSGSSPGGGGGGGSRGTGWTSGAGSTGSSSGSGRNTTSRIGD